MHKVVVSEIIMLKDAKIDGELMASLGNSIKISESAARYCSAADGIAATKNIAKN
jgi:hypothetical protein